MPDFTLLGGSVPAADSQGVMTQGLGFPLRDVDPGASGGTEARVIYEVPGDYATVQLAVEAAKTSGAETVVVRAPGETWTMTSDQLWQNPEYPNMVIQGTNAGGDVTIDGQANEIDLYYNHRWQFERCDIKDIRFNLYESSILILGFNHTLLYDATGGYTLPHIRMYETSQLHLPHGTGNLGYLYMFESAYAVSAGTQVNFDHISVGAGQLVLEMYLNARFDCGSTVLDIDHGSATTLTGNSISLNGSAVLHVAGASGVERSTANAGTNCILINDDAEAWVRGDVNVTGGNKSNLTQTAKGGRLYI